MGFEAVTSAAAARSTARRTSRRLGCPPLARAVSAAAEAEETVAVARCDEVALSNGSNAVDGNAEEKDEEKEVTPMYSLYIALPTMLTTKMDTNINTLALRLKNSINTDTAMNKMIMSRCACHCAQVSIARNNNPNNTVWLRNTLTSVVRKEEARADSERRRDAMIQDVCSIVCAMVG